MFHRRYIYERGLDGFLRRFDLFEKRAKPRKVLGNAEIVVVRALSAILTQEQIAKYFGVSRAGFYNMCRFQPEILREYEKGLTEKIADVGGVLLEKCLVDKHPASIFFFLKTRAGWRETIGLDQAKRMEDEFGAKENVDLSKLSDDDLIKIKEIFSKYKDENV